MVKEMGNLFSLGFLRRGGSSRCVGGGFLGFGCGLAGGISLGAGPECLKLKGQKIEYLPMRRKHSVAKPTYQVVTEELHDES
jgi:hypothetical protein